MTFLWWQFYVALGAGVAFSAILALELRRRRLLRPRVQVFKSSGVYTPSPQEQPLGRRVGATVVYTPEEIAELVRRRRRDAAVGGGGTPGIPKGHVIEEWPPR